MRDLAMGQNSARYMDVHPKVGYKRSLIHPRNPPASIEIGQVDGRNEWCRKRIHHWPQKLETQKSPIFPHISWKVDLVLVQIDCCHRGASCAQKLLHKFARMWQLGFIKQPSAFGLNWYRRRGVCECVCVSRYIYIYDAALPGPPPRPQRVWVYRYRAKRLCSPTPPVWVGRGVGGLAVVSS